MSPKRGTEKRTSRSYLPVLEWLPQFERSFLQASITAALTMCERCLNPMPRPTPALLVCRQRSDSTRRWLSRRSAPPT